MKPGTRDPEAKARTAREKELLHYRRIEEDGKLLAEAFRDLEAREREPHWPVCFRVAADMLERARAKGCRCWTGPALQRQRASSEDEAKRKHIYPAAEVL